MSRRRFLKKSTIGLSAIFGSLQSCNFISNRKRPYSEWNWNPSTGGYGQLQQAGPELALPPEFQYRTISVDGQIMKDGDPTPPLPDGMAAYSLPNGNIRLIRNHEIGLQESGIKPGRPDVTYDPLARGGVSSLEIDPKTREIVSDFVVLRGTNRNCSGGITPWGTWLSCEESMSHTKDGFSKPHGYVFEVPILAGEQASAIPIKALGRFVHESIAIDGDTGIVYQTEDINMAGFYRFLPNVFDKSTKRIDFSAGGQLQALRIPDNPNFDLKVLEEIGIKFDIDWINIEEVDPEFDFARDELDEYTIPPVFQQALDQGAAIFSRCEGCVMENSAVLFSCTRAGKGNGQIWRITPKNDSTGTLELLYVSPNEHVLSGPDNLCVSPQGSLIICEDSESDPKRVVALSAKGAIIPIAENIIDDEEFAGATFSPDGSTLFVNIQGDIEDDVSGRTLAIWGPWHSGAV